MTLATYKWSIEEWHNLVASGVLSGKKVELLAGDIIPISPEGIPHRKTNHQVVKYLRTLLAGRAEVYESHPITLADSEPEPDVAVVRLPETIYDQHHPYPEDIYWLIEIANETLLKDLQQKSLVYAHHGIREYWVINLKHNCLVVHTQPHQDQYQQIEQYQSGRISPVAFPQLEVAVSSLLLH